MQALNPMNPPNLAQLGRYDINRKNMAVGVYQPLYDIQTYNAATGHSTLTFFALPRGQGTPPKTLDDTNMEGAGQMPAPKQQLVTGIQVIFMPGNTPGSFGAQRVAENWNDNYEIFRSGNLEFFIGSQPYLNEAPIGKFPVSFRLAGEGAIADASTPEVDQQSLIDYATFAGTTYNISPVRLVSNQNFNVTLNWGTPILLPSGQNARIGINLLGFQYRLSQ